MRKNVAELEAELLAALEVGEGGRAGWELGTVPLFFIRPNPLPLNELSH